MSVAKLRPSQILGLALRCIEPDGRLSVTGEALYKWAKNPNKPLEIMLSDELDLTMKTFLDHRVRKE